MVLYQLSYSRKQHAPKGELAGPFGDGNLHRTANNGQVAKPLPALGNRLLSQVDGGLVEGRDRRDEQLRPIDGPQGLLDQLQHSPVIAVGFAQDEALVVHSIAGVIDGRLSRRLPFPDSGDSLENIRLSGIDLLQSLGFRLIAPQALDGPFDEFQLLAGY